MASGSLRVGYDISALNGRLSGVGTYTYQLLQALYELQDGPELLLLTNRPSAALLPAEWQAVLPQTAFPSRMLWMQCVLPGLLRQLQPAVCHFTNSIAPLFCPAPLVLTIHDMTLSRMPLAHPLRKQALVRPLIPLLARRAACIITVSRHSRDDIVRLLRVPPTRVAVVAEAAAPAFQPLAEAEHQRVRKLYGLHKPYLLYVGTIEPRKNLLRLLQAWNLLRRHKRIEQQLVLVGAPGWGYRGLFAALQRLEYRPEVRLTGYVPLADLPALYGAADGFAFPSLLEGFGLPVAEALACGVPTLISATPALLELAGNAALSVNPYQVEAIAAGLEQLLTDQMLRAVLRERGLQRSAEFSWRRAAQETLQVYRQASLTVPQLV